MLRLLSSGLVHTPGIIRWAECAYRTGDPEMAVTVMVDGYKLKPEFARQLLAGEIEYTVNGENVEIDVDPADATTTYPDIEVNDEAQ